MIRIFISILLIFGTVILGIFYLGPAWQSFQNLRSATRDLTEISAELDDLIANRDTLIATINQISKNDLARLQQTLPQGISGATFLVSLEAVILRHGLQFNSIDIATAPTAAQSTAGVRAQPKPGTTQAPVRAQGTIGELPFNITVTGSYGAIKNFIDDLEHMVPIVDIGEISFNAPSKSDVLTVLIKAKTYYQ